MNCSPPAPRRTPAFSLVSGLLILLALAAVAALVALIALAVLAGSATPVGTSDRCRLRVPIVGGSGLTVSDGHCASGGVITRNRRPSDGDTK
ncbi:hypothetical protein ACVLV4_002252 [Rathayibacter agropyri]|nr:hypothetical protein [Rathayibacter agropyri]